MLSVFQSLWAMEGLPWRAATPWSLEERVRRAAEAGFAGVGVDTYSPETVPRTTTLAPLLRETGLRSSVTVFVTEDRPISNGLEYAAELGAELVVVCGQVFPDETDDAAELVSGWMAEADRAGLPMHLETHRYTLTNDLAFTARLVERVPNLKLSLDLSHYVVGNELPDGHTPRVEERIAALLARCGSVQGRVATREQIQVPLTFPQHHADVERFRRWWAAAFAQCQEDDCVFLCELGPAPYPVTGADGHELSDRWEEALLLREWAQELFA